MTDPNYYISRNEIRQSLKLLNTFNVKLVVIG